MKRSILAVSLLPLLLAGCGNDATPVAGPFYLMYFETRDQMALFRCPDGPDGGCAINGPLTQARSKLRSSGSTCPRFQCG